MPTEMDPAVLALSVCSGVLVAELAKAVTAKLKDPFGRNKFSPQDQRPFDSLLPTPIGYENLQRVNRTDDDSSLDLYLGSRIGYGSFGVVFQGKVSFDSASAPE